MSWAISKFRPSKALILQASSAGLLGITGDVICQKLVENSENVNFKRSLKFGLVIAFAMAPIQYNWFKFLERKINHSNKMVMGLKRMLADQSIAAPILTSSFIFVLQLVNGHSIESAVNKLRTSFVPVMSTNYKVWPLVQFLNMSVIPLQFRVIFVQFVAIFWNIYLSSKVN